MGLKIFRDAVHGDMHFSEEEVRVIDTWPVQRLRNIKQDGSSNLVFPTAVHTRFDHSLGTCWTARKMMRSMRDHYGIEIPEDEARLVSVSALLHDITHIPFGHTLEDERRIFMRHDDDLERLEYYLGDVRLDAVLREGGLEGTVRHILQVKEHLKEEKPYISQIVSYTICADLLDYLRRDSYFCGLAHSYDDRIFRYFTLVDDALVIDLQKDGMLRPDAISEIVHLLRIRYLLTERVFFHHAKVASGVMISKAVELAVERGWTLRDMYDLGDATLLFELRRRFRDAPELIRLLDQIERRALLRRAYTLTSSIGTEAQQRMVAMYHRNEGGARNSAERELEESLNLPVGSITIYCTALGVQLKEARVLVKADSGPPCSLEQIGNPEIHSLAQKYGQLWRLYVFLDAEFVDRLPAAQAACEEFFGFPHSARSLSAPRN